MQIKNATPKDSKIISHIHALSWKTAYRGLISDKYLDELREDHWVAAFENWLSQKILKAKIIYDDNGVLVGCIAYGFSRRDETAGWGEIVSLYVLPEFFGKGFGGALMKEAITDLKHMGCPKAYLWVLDGNERASRFYKKVGFEPKEAFCEVDIMGQTLRDTRYDYTI